DKEIRAVFLRLFAQLLQGYRWCLHIIRIHPEPVIRFHKVPSHPDQSVIPQLQVPGQQALQAFAPERSPHFLADSWGASGSMGVSGVCWKQSRAHRVPGCLRQELLQTVVFQENPYPAVTMHKVQKPTEGCHLRLHQKPFPRLDEGTVQWIIDQATAKLQTAPPAVKAEKKCMVPSGPPIGRWAQR
ncbi:MTMR5 protein, partial [Rostratula benghalensis]|nr:MTMR5 protein [Rostratula benghalensis]